MTTIKIKFLNKILDFGNKIVYNLEIKRMIEGENLIKEALREIRWEWEGIWYFVSALDYIKKKVIVYYWKDGMNWFDEKDCEDEILFFNKIHDSIDEKCALIFENYDVVLSFEKVKLLYPNLRERKIYG